MSNPARAGVLHDIACTTHRTYMLDCDEYDRLPYAEGRCQLCGDTAAETDRGQLCIDHAHDYGSWAVRGIVCDPCNARLARHDARKEPYSPDIYDYLRNAWFSRRLTFGRGFTIDRGRWVWPQQIAPQLEETA
jgi:hypothetical protein